MTDPLVLLGRLVTFDPAQPVIDEGALYIGADERSPRCRSERPLRRRVRGCAPRDDRRRDLPGLIDLHGHMVYNGLSLWSPPGRTEPYTSRYQWPDEESYEGMISDPANALGALAGKALLKYVEVKAVVGGTTAVQGSAKMAYPYEGWLVRNVEYEMFKTGKKSVYQSALPLRTDADYKKQAQHMKDGNAFIYHLSEGTDPALAAEYTKLRDEDCVRARARGDPLHRARRVELRRLGATRRLGDLVAVLEPLALPRHHTRGRGASSGRPGLPRGGLVAVGVKEPARGAEGGRHVERTHLAWRAIQ